MTKAELIEKIVDAMTDPYTDCAEDYLYCTPVNIWEATDLLGQIRSDENDMSLEPEERLPEEVTPDLVMVAYNCLIRARKHEARVNRLAEFITDNEMVCEYANYYPSTNRDAINLIPVDYLWERFPFDIGDRTPNPFFLIELGQRSPEFSPNHEFCWYDKETNQLFSTDTPFRDGVLDAVGFAEYLMSPDGKEGFEYIIEDIMDNDEFDKVFGCTKEEYLNE